MILSGVDNSGLLSIQPTLVNYYPTGQTTFNSQISEALRVIIRELKKNRKDIKKFCTPLELQASVTKAADFTGSSVDDAIDRMLWKVEISSFTDNCSFELQGTNDDGVTWESVGSISFTSATISYLLFTTTYESYRVLIVTSTSTTYSSQLIESSFYHAHLYLSLSLACKTILKNEGDRFDYLARMYENNYLDEINNMVATYDEDSSGDIDTSDELNKQTSTGFYR